MSESGERIGARVAELRKIHGFTQRALADRASVSYSLLRKVESEDRPASASFTSAVARALSVHIADLTEQPYHARNAGPATDQAGVPALRLALVEGDDPEADEHPRPLAEVEATLLRIKELARRARHAEVVSALPEVLRSLHRRQQANGLGGRASVAAPLAAAYGYALVGLYRLGHLDLAHLADERARAAARAGEDPLRAAVAEWNHALLLLFDGSYRPGVRSIDRAHAFVDAAANSPARAAVRGALHLRAAVLAARAADAESADVQLAEAAALVSPGQEDANHYGTKFSGFNVAVHRVAVPVELADGTTAVTRAATVAVPEDAAPSRVGHYWIDLARGWLLHGDRTKALDALAVARRVAPQLTRHHPQVRETVQALAVRDRRSTSTLSEFAAWCGIRD